MVIARSDDVPEGGRVVVAVDGEEIGIFRLDGRLYAYANYCAHAGGPVCQGMVVSRVVEVLDDRKRSLGDAYSQNHVNLVCPWHGYEYDLRTGVHAGSAGIRLRSFKVRETDGEIVVDL